MAGDHGVDTTEYLGLFLDESAESLRAIGASLPELERRPGDPEPLAVIFRAAHSLKGMSAAMGLDAMARLTHRMEEVLAAMRDDGAPVTPGATGALLACLDTLHEMIDRVAAADPREVDASAVIARLDAVACEAGAVAAAEVAATMAPPRPPAAPARAPATVRVGADRLDALVGLVGEMAAQQRRLARLAGEHDLDDLRATVAEAGRVTDDLRVLVAQVRMTPVDAVFMRFPRMVRDLAGALGKRVELVVDGEDTELDRAIVDHLGDPLLHLLRNAVDHGLETPAERAAAGKDPVGRLGLSARRTGDHVVIEVRDDGRGMDPAALRASAVRRGLVTAGAAASLGDERALDLVFLPGVSTVAVTTDVSGRGVGMDAVRTAVAELDGEVAVTSVPGRGSTLTIRIPLTRGGPPAPAPPPAWCGAQPPGPF